MKKMNLYVEKITIEGGRDVSTVYIDLMDKKGKYIDTVVRQRCIIKGRFLVFALDDFKLARKNFGKEIPIATGRL